MKQPTHTTKRLHLREPRDSDWEDIHKYMQYGTVQAYMPNEPIDYGEKDAREKISSLQNLISQDDANAWVIEHKESSRVIGIIDEQLFLHHRKARLGYHISPEYQRQGLMTEALEELITHGFNHKNVHKYTAEIASDNQPSRSFIESIGFKEEGSLRAELFIKGQFHDIIHYGLLADEWNND